MNESLGELIRRARGGEVEAREKLIRAWQPFVRLVASGVCGRHLSWDAADDELSIALIAFNEAIDRYESERGVEFAQFARLVITSRLRDYIRREARHRHLALVLVTSDGEEHSPGEYGSSTTRYEAEQDAQALAEEIAELDALLRRFGFNFRSLARCSPRHRETRDRCVQVALELARDPQLLGELSVRRRLPLSELQRRTGVSRKVLETWRRYIVALTLILACPQFAGLRQFLHMDGELGAEQPSAGSSG